MIQRAIQTGNIQEIDESIKKIEQKLQEQSYDCVMGHLKRLFANILGQDYVLFENDTFNSTLIELSKSCKQLCTISNEQRSQRNQIVSAGIMTYIRDNLSNSNLSVQDVADYFGISASQVSRLLKIYQSTSFSTYLTQVRLDRACDLLKNKSESIIDISIACGFNTPNYFSTIFKKHFSVSPRMYQQLSGDLRPRVDSNILAVQAVSGKGSELMQE